MRLTFLFILCVAWLLLSGCSTVDPDGYYTKGWLNPKTLDDPEPPPSHIPSPDEMSAF